jgi:hypothetical protein
VSALPSEVDAWLQRSAPDKEPLKIHMTQVRALKVLVDALVTGHRDLLATLSATAPDFSIRALKITRDLIRTQRIWAFFRSQLSLRFSNLATAILNEEAWPGSNYGSRVDCSAPAERENITTTGRPPNSTAHFGATSAAAAIVAGAALLLQSMHRHRHGRFLPCREIRQAFTMHGRQPGTKGARNAPPTPDLFMAARALRLLP